MSEELSFYKSEVQRLRVELAQTKELVSLREVQISNLLTIVESIKTILNMEPVTLRNVPSVVNTPPQGSISENIPIVVITPSPGNISLMSASCAKEATSPILTRTKKHCRDSSSSSSDSDRTFYDPKDSPARVSRFGQQLSPQPRCKMPYARSSSSPHSVAEVDGDNFDPIFKSTEQLNSEDDFQHGQQLCADMSQDLFNTELGQFGQ